MYIIDNTTDNNHYSVIENLFSSADELIIVSPFCFPDFGHFFDKLASQGSIKKITFMTTLCGEEIASKTNSLLSFRKMADHYSIGSNILINDSLHGKIYIFKYQGHSINALITSANITNKGLSKNHEWGCCFDDKDMIDSLEKNIMSTVEYSLTNDMLDKVSERVRLHKKEHPIPKQLPSLIINISDIIMSNRFNVTIDSKTRIFLKPIGSNDAKVFDGDYSGETEQYFSKRRPKAVRKNDILISYAVGARKIVSIFRVLSNTPLNTGDQDSRWPWYVEVENITPKLGEAWHKRDELYIMHLANEYVVSTGSIVTNNGGDTLGALQWGVDKIQLAHNFGVYLMSQIMAVEEKM